MEVYFVRHGQTSGNVARRHQAENSSLTKVGEEQAIAVAKELKDYKPTHLLTSPLVRAIETARVIGSECNLTPAIVHEARELERPARLYGNHHFTFDSLSVYLQWYFSNREGTSEEYGESYASLRARIVAVQTELLRYPENARVVVVSHGVFINFFLAHMCHPERMTLGRAVKVFGRILRTPNTSIMPVYFDADRTGTCQWFVQ